MENGNGGGVGGGGMIHKISSDDVISKLKDDGDFDRLRLKIIRKLKENEELRNSIVSMVKQSVALNRPGAENMKPRQLSDAIHHEIGGKVNDQISNGLWEIIKSGEGMRSEITETVKSVYNKLSKPKNDEIGEPSHHDTNQICKEQEHDLHKSNLAPTNEPDSMSDNEPEEPPGFSQTKDEIAPIPLSTLPMEEEKQQKEMRNDSLDPSSPPGFSSGVNHNQPCDDSDEDFDAPPGFG